ncbi:MAG: PBP1A family penicillin-binding protein [bacterium]|nr:PBP1A family penicillin-binding protein [bacterium]
MAERKFHRQTYGKKRGTGRIKPLLKILGIGLVGGILIAVFLIISYAKDLPRPEKFTEKETAQSTKIYARDGQTILYEIYGEEKRTVIPLDQINNYLQKAVIAAEDADFYAHHGVSLKAILRAIFVDFKLLKPAQGASTISQQLIRSTYLNEEKTSVRKTREIILALELERRYSKEQILGFYLNQIPFGQNTYGIQTASRAYFNKNAGELSLAQSALLAALIKAPSRLSPYGPNKEELLERKNYVLRRMLELKFISPDEKQQAENEILEFAKITQPIKAPHFVLWLKGVLEEKYGRDSIEGQGLKIYTTIDWETQKAAEEIIEKNSSVNEGYHAFNAALVAINPLTGEILAMVGSKSFFEDPYPKDCIPGDTCLFEPQFNAALASRQPGSSFKPFVYATAFEKGYDDKTVVIDEPTSFGIWGGKEYAPRNYDGLFRGPVTLRQALAQSLNIPSIKTLLNLAGLEDSVQTAKDFGISTLEPPYGPSIVLGGYEVKLLEMVSAYGVFANNGLWVRPTPILRIENDKGEIIEENKIVPKRVMETKVTAIINDILSDNAARAPVFGEHSILYFDDYQVAVKTGTTQDFRDGWTIGYSSDIVIGVWTGNNNNSSIRKEPGVVVAGPIFHQLMEMRLNKTSPAPLLRIQN